MQTEKLTPDQQDMSATRCDEAALCAEKWHLSNAELTHLLRELIW